eukprot:1147674-Pelagomonas_calceolata.AAC.2
MDSLEAPFKTTLQNSLVSCSSSLLLIFPSVPLLSEKRIFRHLPAFDTMTGSSARILSPAPVAPALMSSADGGYGCWVHRVFRSRYLFNACPQPAYKLGIQAWIPYLQIGWKGSRAPGQNRRAQSMSWSSHYVAAAIPARIGLK